MAHEPELEFGDLIRAGRTFTVRRARGRHPERKLIIKTPTEGAANPSALERLENEYEITRGVEHPGMLVATDRFDGPDGPILFFPDEDLISLDLRPRAALEISEVRRIAAALAGALDTLHTAGIVHRDVEPSNVITDAGYRQIRLIDFCLATRESDLADEDPGAMRGQGTATYMAPEQAGRSNRRTDRRSDLYSLGILLYEIATGRKPFDDDDPSMVLHRHMTEVPPPPSSIDPAIPVAMSNAIMALIEKNPEDRLQSGAELMRAMGSGTTAPRFALPDGLFGREALLGPLRADIAAGAAGPNRVYRIHGPSGIGKTALVEAGVAAAAEAGAEVVHGKFDQLDRTRPYAPLVQAANILLRRILSCSVEEVDEWRTRIAEAVSPNGQVVLDLLPEYEALLGPQPRIAKLGLNESRIRVSMVFRRFFRALARDDRPLILFLDDMQWSDAASRDLLQLLLTGDDLRNFTLIAAYRSNEVGPTHPATALFADLSAAGVPSSEIAVGPLSRGDIAAFTGAALGRRPGDVDDLAELIETKTGGNPFFVRQFLLALNRKGLIHAGEEGATWDLAAIEAEAITDNVADLVIERIRELPTETQQAICTASRIGASFDVETLALVTEQSIATVTASLARAQAADIVHVAEAAEGEGTTYSFQHDRVQEAAAAMIPEDSRAAIHARIGRLLLAQADDNTPGRHMVAIADHLIAGRAHLSAGECEQLRDLVLFAANRTKRANAWDAALAYLDVASELLGADAWATEPDRAFRTDLERAEAAYLRGTSDQAEEIARSLLSRDLDAMDRIRVLELIILIHTARLEYRRALEVGQEALTLLGEKLPISPGPTKLMGELVRAKLLLRGRSDDSFLNLPTMTEPEKLAIIRVLGLLAAPAYFTELYLLPLIGIRIVMLSVRHGNAGPSAYGYVIYGMLHCAVLGNPVRGRAFGELARRIAAKFGARDIEGRVLMVYGGFIQHWTGGLNETLPVFLEGAEKSLAVGDLEYHGYTRYGHGSYALMAGHPLGRVADLMADHLRAVRANRHEKTTRIMQMASASIARMRGLPEPEQFDAGANFALWTEQQDATSLAYFHKYSMLEALMAANYAEVLRQADGMRANLNGILSMGYQPYYVFYEGLAAAELARRAGPVMRRRLIFRLMRTHWRLARWARHAPGRLDHRVTLLKAEIDALAGRSALAVAGFGTAIKKAREARALHDIGLFNERAARFYLEGGAEAPARMYLADARAGYDAWGGAAWSRALEERHRDLLPSAPRRMLAANVSESTTSGGQIIDSQTLISVAAALTRKTTLDGVVEEVMRAMVVNAGADRGVLLLDFDGTYSVVAETGADGRIVMAGETPLPDHPDLPVGLINYVARAARQVVLDDARLDPDFGDDPYFEHGAAASVLCVPLMAQGDVTGVVYLENSRLRGAFTPERCETVSVLGAQAAVSVENAHLVEELQGALERQVELTSAHARFVPHSFLEMMNRRSIADVKLGDHVEADASILFSDIRGFTRLVETMAPAEAIDFINAYLSRMEPAVQAGGGFVDSYIGDAVMAVFDRGPEAAVAAGVEMIRRLRAWTRAQENEGQPIRIGVGIATGRIMFGTIGAANRLKCGVIGDAVNLAARIEGLTKTYNLGLLITQGTYRALPDPDKFQIREVDLVTVVGRTAPVRLFEVFDADPPSLRAQKAATANDVARALRLYRTGALDQAREILNQCMSLAPDDPLIRSLAERCSRPAVTSSLDDWDGVEHHERK